MWAEFADDFFRLIRGPLDNVSKSSQIRCRWTTRVEKSLLADRRKSTSFYVNFVEKSRVSHNVLIEQPRLYLRDKWIEIVTKGKVF